MHSAIGREHQPSLRYGSAGEQEQEQENEDEDEDEDEIGAGIAARS